MLDEKVAALQFARLRRMPGYPDGGEKPWIDALAKSANSIEHGARIIDRIIETTRRNEQGYPQFPLPAEIIDVAGCVPALEPAPFDFEPSSTCGCNGGWLVIEDLRKDPITKRLVNVSAVKPCPRCQPATREVA
jgi:hypothetical protein